MLVSFGQGFAPRACCSVNFVFCRLHPSAVADLSSSSLSIFNGSRCKIKCFSRTSAVVSTHILCVCKLRAVSLQMKYGQRRLSHVLFNAQTVCVKICSRLPLTLQHENGMFSPKSGGFFVRIFFYVVFFLWRCLCHRSTMS